MTYIGAMDFLVFFLWATTIFVAAIFCLSGMDEFFFDTLFFIYYIYERIIKRRKPIDYDILMSSEEQKIAIMIPCWHEHLVIGKMLKHNLPKIKYKNYDVFVGVYPNDPDTIAVLNKLHAEFVNLHVVIGLHPGPSTKSENLNVIYTHIKQYENDTGKKYSIFLMHDSEDIIHPLALKLYNTKIPEYDMVQTPVFPLPGAHKNQVQWIYNDEFGEAHLKDIYIRTFIGGFIPSAGVGTGFSRKAFEVLTHQDTVLPFTKGTLTEDYNTALRVHLAGLKTLFLLEREPSAEPRKKWRSNTVDEYIATRALFPSTYKAALRQRTRWMVGIAFQEAYLTGWPGTLATRYLLLHDRKAAFVNIINGLAYLVFIFSCITYLLGILMPSLPNMIYLLNEYPWIYSLIAATSCSMLIRMVQRIGITYRLYGRRAALGSILRIVYANMLNAHTSIMALYAFLKMKYKGVALKWNKTTNLFPESHI